MKLEKNDFKNLSEKVKPFNKHKLETKKKIQLHNSKGFPIFDINI